jgi:uncharacterized damage-inducible protein DinB
MPSDRIATLVSDWTRARKGALEFVDAMPEHLISFYPVPEVFSFAEQMIHIASVNYRFAAGAAEIENPYDKTKGADPEKDETLKTGKQALRDFVGGSYDFMIKAIEGMDPAKLDEEVPFHKWTLTRGAMIAKSFEHHAHHRGSCAVYFRLNGLKPPPEGLF